MKYGARNVNTCDAERFIPLHMQTMHDRMKLCKSLLPDVRGYYVNLTTTDGENSTELAHLKDKSEIEKSIRAKMASSQRRDARK